MKTGSTSSGWKFAYWLLFPAWVAGAAMNMWHLSGGLFTNYVADLTFPPWYYIVIRGLTTTGNKPPLLLRWFGASAELTVISILLAGVVYELGQRFKVIPGTFDLLDIVAYSVGLLACYGCEQRRSGEPRASAGN